MVSPPIARGRTIARLEGRQYTKLCARWLSSQAAVPVSGVTADERLRPREPRTARLIARAPADRPISAISAAACTAVPRISPPFGGARRRRAAEPTGAARGGWSLAVGREGRQAERADAAGCPRWPPACRPRRAWPSPFWRPLFWLPAFWRGFLAAGFLAAGFLAAGVLAAAFLAAGFVAAGVVSGPGAAAALVAARLSLRRCGRVRGSPPRTSEWRSSLIDRDMIAHPGFRCAVLHAASPWAPTSSAREPEPISHAIGSLRGSACAT